MIIIKANFIKPKAPILYTEVKRAIKLHPIKYNNWASPLGNKRYETWYYKPLLIIKEHEIKDLPVPVGHE